MTTMQPTPDALLGPSAHTDSFARDNLPPPSEWPDFLLGGFDYPERINAAVELTDAMVARGHGDRTALIGNGRRRTYKELSDWTNRLAHALVDDLGVRPGNRVLIRSANNPAMVAAWLAATKAGAVVVNTMPLLRAGELSRIVDKAEIAFALCDTRLMDELVTCAKGSRFLRKVVGFLREFAAGEAEEEAVPEATVPGGGRRHVRPSRKDGETSVGTSPNGY